jgi:hypothetical protein
MKNIILAWIIFILMAITLITAILTANNRYKHKCSPDTVYIKVYKQKSDWELLKTAIIWQESKGNPKAIGGNGYGLYQITPIYVKECNRIIGYNKYRHIDAFVDSTANDMFEVVQSYHNTEKCPKKAIRLHNKDDKYYQEVMDKYNMLKYLNDK